MLTAYVGNLITYERNNIMDYEGDLTKLSWGVETIFFSPCAPTFKYLNFQQEKAEQSLCYADQEGCQSWKGWA